MINGFDEMGKLVEDSLPFKAFNRSDELNPWR
jgi:hypothetical protein